jgi:transposase InsO family protein
MSAFRRESVGMQSTDAQVRKLMEEFNKHGQVGRAALRADMDRKTARRYLREQKLPSELKKPRTWRTRENPFEEDWPWVEGLLQTMPELEAKTLFLALQERRPGHYDDGKLRTLQRHVKRWRALSGPEQEVFLPQQHRPGEAAQTDFTSGNELGITIAGVAFMHMLCNFVLPYSNWQWVTVCLSESYLAMKRGVQAALFRLGRRPEWHQTDNSTSATHRPRGGKREFNDDYAALMRHLGMKPRTTAVGRKEQNGDVEASNGALKRRLEQHLLLRGSRDFDSVEEYEEWVVGVVTMANRGRAEKLAQELGVMAVVDVKRLPEHKELDVTVTAWSTIRVLFNTYSVPSRLKGEDVRVRVYERHIEVLYANEIQMVTERLRGRNGHRINYRHLIWSLVRKPGGFARYRYRDELFPTLTFRRAYDAIAEKQPNVQGDLEYLRILHLAAATLEADVEAALDCLLEAGSVPSADAVKELVSPDAALTDVPELGEYAVDLGVYDGLLSGSGVAS